MSMTSGFDRSMKWCCPDGEKFDYDTIWSHQPPYTRNLPIRTFRFLELPIEVRQLVYKKLIGTGEILLLNRERGYNECAPWEVFTRLVVPSAIASFDCVARAGNPQYVHTTDNSNETNINNPRFLEPALLFPSPCNPCDARNVCKTLLYTSKRIQKEALPVFLSHAYINLLDSIAFWSFGHLCPNLAQYIKHIDGTVKEYYDYMQLEHKFGTLKSLFPNLQSLCIRGHLAHTLRNDRNLRADPRLTQIFQDWDQDQFWETGEVFPEAARTRKLYQELGQVLATLVYETEPSTGDLKKKDLIREECKDDFPLRERRCGDDDTHDSEVYIILLSPAKFVRRTFGLTDLIVFTNRTTGIPRYVNPLSHRANLAVDHPG